MPDVYDHLNAGHDKLYTLWIKEWHNTADAKMFASVNNLILKTKTGWTLSQSTKNWQMIIVDK
jgi:hypothetical protein